MTGLTIPEVWLVLSLVLLAFGIGRLSERMNRAYAWISLSGGVTSLTIAAIWFAFAALQS